MTAAALVGAGTANAQPTNTASSTFTGGCGVVSYPGTGVRGVAKVTSGPLPCTAAMEIIDRYLHDPALAHSGNTWTAQFDGWVCATPTAATAEEYGYLSSCRDQFGGEIRVTPEPPSAEPMWVPCDGSAIAADIGEPLNVERCYGNWAYVRQFGDAQSMIRLVNGTWERYTGFPSNICSAQAAADGVPGPELSNFIC